MLSKRRNENGFLPYIHSEALQFTVSSLGEVLLPFYKPQAEHIAVLRMQTGGLCSVAKRPV